MGCLCLQKVIEKQEKRDPAVKDVHSPLTWMVKDHEDKKADWERNMEIGLQKEGEVLYKMDTEDLRT